MAKSVTYMPKSGVFLEGWHEEMPGRPSYIADSNLAQRQQMYASLPNSLDATSIPKPQISAELRRRSSADISGTTSST